MRPTVPVFLSLILLAGLLPASAEAGFIKCVKTGFVEGRNATPYRVRCVHQNSAKMIGNVISACESAFAVKNISKIVHPRALGLVEKCFDRYR